MTMVEINPSLYSECDESVQELGAETWVQGFYFLFFYSKTTKITHNVGTEKRAMLFMNFNGAHCFLFFYTIYNWSGINLA